MASRRARGVAVASSLEAPPSAARKRKNAKTVDDAPPSKRLAGAPDKCGMCQVKTKVVRALVVVICSGPSRQHKFSWCGCGPTGPKRDLGKR